MACFLLSNKILIKCFPWQHGALFRAFLALWSCEHVNLNRHTKTGLLEQRGNLTEASQAPPGHFQSLAKLLTLFPAMVSARLGVPEREQKEESTFLPETRDLSVSPLETSPLF